MVLGIVALFAVLLGGIALVLAICCTIELKAMQKSTHKIQYVPVETPADFTPDDISEEKLSTLHEGTNPKDDRFNKDYDNVI